MKPNKKTIMVIDDHPIIHDGLKTLLLEEPDLEIVDTASSGEEAISKLKQGQPDLMILVYTMSEEKLFAERSGLAGANGYVMKTSPPSSLKEAIRTLLAGE